MTVKLGINGFGRIGRLVLRAAWNHPEVQVVAVNDLADAATMAHLLKYDSTQGKFNGTVTSNVDHIVINKKSIKIFTLISWRFFVQAKDTR